MTLAPGRAAAAAATLVAARVGSARKSGGMVGAKAAEKKPLGLLLLMSMTSLKSSAGASVVSGCATIYHVIIYSTLFCKDTGYL